MLRYGKPVAEKLEAQVKNKVEELWIAGKYVAIIMIGAEHPWAAYVSSKQKFAERVWLEVKIFWNDDSKWTEVDIRKIIENCNDDGACVWIILQLPLPDDLHDAKQRLLDAIDPTKDIDALSSWHQEKMMLLPATPCAVLHIINHYAYDVQWKEIAMIGNSNLIWRPLAFALEYKWALVRVFTIESDQEEMRQFCHDKADMIISATWSVHLVTKEFIRDDKSQCVIDVGRWYKDGKAVGDVIWQDIENDVAAITPVPGWVWPVTVAALFANVITLFELKRSWIFSQ